MTYTTADFLNDIRNGVKEQEIADPAESENVPANENELTDAEEENQLQEKNGEKTEDEIGAKERKLAETAEEPDQEKKAERARQAAARREREKQRAVEAAREDERERNNERLKRMMNLAGWKNSEGKTIETVEELDSYLEELEDRRFQKDLADGKIKREDIARLVAGEVEKQTAQREAAEAETEENAFEKTAAEELRQIALLDPKMTDLQTILDSENGEEFRRLVMEHGHSFIEAFKIANAGKLAEEKQRKAAEAAAQEAYNASKSKNHMTPIKSRGEGAASVPEDVRAMYRRFNKGITDEEIRKDWQKRQTGT